jgi:hypothetical protein
LIWLRRFHSLPSGEKKKELKGQRPQRSSGSAGSVVYSQGKKQLNGRPQWSSPFFFSLTTTTTTTTTKKNAFRRSLSFYRKNIFLISYIGEQKLTSSRVPIHASAGVLPLSKVTLLVTLIKLFLNYKHLVEKNQVSGFQGKQAKQNRQKKIDHGYSGRVAAAGHT